ncbi:hypothetical protein VDGL01_07529 [Verticillium dahliae]
MHRQLSLPRSARLDPPAFPSWEGSRGSFFFKTPFHFAAGRLTAEPSRRSGLPLPFATDNTMTGGLLAPYAQSTPSLKQATVAVAGYE